MRDLTGKVAWITGAGSGIGEAAARALAECGMVVVLSGRRTGPLAAVAAQIGPRARVLALDVAEQEAVAAAAASLLADHGRCDILVNNAGINVAARNWHNVTPSAWDKVVRINLDGAYYCTRAVLPTMQAQGDGLVINVSSWAGRFVSMLTGPAYTAAKHGMNAMTQSLNMEYGIHGVRACAICPGEVNTPILENRPVPVPPEERARMLQPEDCAAAIAFVARLPPHVCLNEMIISPTWNRAFVRQAQALGS